MEIDFSKVVGTMSLIPAVHLLKQQYL